MTTNTVKVGEKVIRLMKNDITVVIPTLNEADAIGAVLDEVMGVGVPRDKILVVDGGSRDGTVDIVRSKGVAVIEQEGKGKADAIKTALRYINTPYVLVMDGDYSYPGEYIPLLIEKLSDNVDLVIGRRIPEPGAQSFLYRLGNVILTSVFNLLFSTKFHDVLSGMYLMKTNVLREVSFQSKGFGIESEIVAHVASSGGYIVEVPIRYRKRLGKKKLGLRHGISILKTMFDLAWSYNPVSILFFVASLLVIPGTILGGWVFYRYMLYGVVHYVRALIAIIMVTTGLNALMLAILALYLKRQEIRLIRMFKRARS